MENSSNNYSEPSLDVSDSGCNVTDYETDYSYDVFDILEWIAVCVGLPLTLPAIVAVFLLIRKDHTVSVYMINLLISDLIQLCCIAAWKIGKSHKIIYYSYYFCLMASAGFMVCISLERYLIIAWPLWYRFRRNIKTSLLVCAVVWLLPLVDVIPDYYDVDFELTIVAIYFLLPFPLFVFFLVGTIRALSAARSVPADEKRRIVAILFTVLLIYTLIFLPSIIWYLIEGVRCNWKLLITSFTLLEFSPLTDLIMYFFIRKGAVDKLLASLPCCKISKSQQLSNVTFEMSASCSQVI